MYLIIISYALNLRMLCVSNISVELELMEGMSDYAYRNCGAGELVGLRNRKKPSVADLVRKAEMSRKRLKKYAGL